MLLLFFLLIHSLQLISIYATESDIKSALSDIKSEQSVMRGDQQLIREDQRIIRSDVGRLLSDQHQFKSDQVFIKQELVQRKADLETIIDDQTDMKKDLQEIKEILRLTYKGQESLEKTLGPQGFIHQQLVQGKADLNAIRDGAYLKNYVQEVNEMLRQSKKGQESLEKTLGPQGFIHQQLVQGKADLKAIRDGAYLKNYVQEVNEMLGQSKKAQESLEKKLDTLLVKLEPLANQSKSFGRSCADATASSKRSGIYDIRVPLYSDEPFKVYCDAETMGGNWLTILRRVDGSVEFIRNWTDYKNGFGDIDREFFLGMDKIHVITQDQQQELLVMLEDYDGTVAYETYDAFGIGSESEQYKLHTLGSASGHAGDSLRYHHGMSFTTADRDNDYSDMNCAVFYPNPWWHRNCFESNLFGIYGDHTYGRGIIWKTFRGYAYSLRRVLMMIRPKRI